MAKRHSNAVAIQEGACNPSGVCHSLLDAIRECREEGLDGDGVRNDEAVMAICHQLAFLCNVDRMNNEFTEYNRVMLVCQEGKEKFENEIAQISDLIDPA